MLQRGLMRANLNYWYSLPASKLTTFEWSVNKASIINTMGFQGASVMANCAEKSHSWWKEIKENYWLHQFGPWLCEVSPSEAVFFFFWPGRKRFQETINAFALRLDVPGTTRNNWGCFSPFKHLLYSDISISLESMSKHTKLACENRNVFSFDHIHQTYVSHIDEVTLDFQCRETL